MEDNGKLARVFISYSRKDLAVAEPLRNALVESGFDAYLDRDDIKPGEPWQERLDVLIANAEKIIFLISPDSVASDICAWEVDHAERLGKSLLPIVIRQTENKAIPGRLSRLNFIFMLTAKECTAKLPELIESLTTDLAWEREKTRINTLAMTWEQAGRQKRLLMFPIDTIRAAEQWRDNHPATSPPPSEIQLAYISDSRIRYTHRQRVMMTSTVVIAIIMTVLSVFTLFLRQQAIEQRDLAEARYNMSFSRQLATQARNRLTVNDLDLALLLSLEAVNKFKTAEARTMLLNGLSSSPRLISFIHVNSLSSLSFSSEGNALMVADRKGTVRWWDRKNWQPIGQPLETLQDSVSRTVFSPNGMTLALASLDEVWLWDIQSRQQIGQSIKMQNGRPVDSIVLSPDGKILATTSGSDGAVTLWDTQSQEPIDKPIKSRQRFMVRDVAFSTDGKILATAVWGHATLWDLQKQRPFSHHLNDYPFSIDKIAFSPDGSTIALSGNGTVTLWDIQKWQRIEPSLKSRVSADSLVFSPDSKILAGTIIWDGNSNENSNRKKVVLWDIQSKDTLEITLNAHKGLVDSLTFSPDGSILATANHHGTVMLWDMHRKDTLGQPLRAHNGTVTSVAFSPDGNTLASAGGDRTVMLWDPQSPQPIMPPIYTHQDWVFSLAFSPNGKLLASGSRGEKIILFDTQNWQPIGTPLKGHTGDVNSVAFSPDGSILASAGEDGTVMLWDALSQQLIGQPIQDNEVVVSSLAFSPDSNFLALARRYGGGLILWDIQSQQRIGPLLEQEYGDLHAVAFSPDGKTLAVGGDLAIILLDTKHWHPIWTDLESHLGSVYGVAFSPNGMLASASEDGTVRLWDVATRQPIGQPLRGHDEIVTSVAFSPDGNILASAGEDSIVMLWDVNLTSWERLAGQIVNRNLSCDEWARYMGIETYEVTIPNLPIENCEEPNVSR